MTRKQFLRDLAILSRPVASRVELHLSDDELRLFADVVARYVAAVRELDDADRRHTAAGHALATVLHGL